jgi:hypothetical protein
MSNGYTLLLVTAAAGLIAGAGAHTFAAAAAAAASAVWLQSVGRAKAQDLYANLDPEDPDGALLLDALREALALLSRTRQPVRLRIAAFARKAHATFHVSLNREADLEVSGGSRRSALKQPGVWLPDHPLPLVLPRDRSVTLLLEPCGAERVRASLAAPASRSPRSSLPLLLAAAACVLDSDWLLAAALGFAFQARLPDDQPERASGNPKVQRP